MAARMGGDEFLAVLPGADQRAAKEFLRRFEKELDTINKREKRSFQVEASYGSYVVRLDEMTSMEDCMRLSDEAMYRAKEERHAGR
jgi:diguanylate cyclase (GGDEF)-like protein